MSAIEIRPLTPALADDYLELFDRAFCDNADWSDCYCLFHHSAEEPFAAGPLAGPAHRAARLEQLQRGGAPGFLAYLDGLVVGWLDAGPRAAFQNLRGLPEGAPGEALVMCFVVAPDARRRGVAGALLDFALADLARQGCTAVVGHPPMRSRPELSWEAASYKGPLSLFLARGFELVERGGRRVARREL
jgi:GNAT superfamily N-acetyltransferase